MSKSKKEHFFGDNGGVILAAIITAIVSLIVGYWQFIYKPAHGLEYVGHVLDTESLAPISNAKVSLNLEGVPPIVYTDSQGVYVFELTIKSDISGQVRVDAQGYQTYIQNITISPDIKTIGDIRLSPNVSASPTPSSSPAITQTDMPVSTQTPLPSSTPDPTEFRGFDKNCIDQNYWGVSVFQGETAPSTYKQNSKICYNLSSKGVSSQNQGLRFNVSPLASPFFGIYTSLPSHTDADIHFKFNIDAFTTDINSADGILIFGVSDSKDWNYKNGNYLFYSIRYAYHSNDIHLEVGTSKILPSYQWGIVTPKVGSDILFSIRGIDLYIYVNGQTMDYYPRSLSQLNGKEVFWVGYQLPVSKSNLQASLTDFSIVEK